MVRTKRLIALKFCGHAEAGEIRLRLSAFSLESKYFEKLEYKDNNLN